MPFHAYANKCCALAFALSATALSPPAVAAASTDCGKLAHTSEPYQATMQVGKAKLEYQVYRSKTSETTLVVRGIDGLVTKLKNDSTFPKSMTLPNNIDATFAYSIPTDKPIYEQGAKQFTSKLEQNNKVLLENIVKMEYKPDEKLGIGSCTFETKHYVQTVVQNGRESRSEIWFSPELQLGIKILSSVKRDDQLLSKESVVTKLATDFTPIK